MRLKTLFIFTLVCSALRLYGQAPNAAFTAPSNACLNETLAPQNTSTAATQYIWDFCHEDLKATPTASLQTTLPTVGGFFYHTIRFVFDNGEWIGFATDLSGSKLYRLDFGNNLTNTPAIINLGTLTGFGTPGGLELVRHGNIWYAFVLNLFGNSMVRVTFGNGLKQLPTLSEDLGNVDAALSTPSGLRIIYDGVQYWAAVVNLSSNTLRIFAFGNSPANVPSLAATVGPASFSDIYGIDVMQHTGNWFVLLGSFSASKTYLLNFGASITNVPTVTEINGIPQGADVALASEGGRVHALARSRTDGLYRIDFGTSLPGTPIVSRLGPLGLLTNESRNFALVRDAPNWKGFTIDSSTGRLYRIEFNGNCTADISLNTSTSETPSGLFYKTPGNYTIELTAKNTAGLTSTTSQAIIVSNQTSSGITINKTNEQCTGSAITFSTTSAGTMNNYSWHFGDATHGSGATVNHAYGSNGSYTISVEATEQNGCKNAATTSVNIFNAPIADFNLPAVAGTVCTLQGYVFTNNTVIDVAAPVSWSWQVDGTPLATTRDLTQSFATVKSYSIALQASIPGCANSISKSFSVTATGPQVGFTFNGQCLGTATQFANTTTGTVTSYSWNFGDGQTSSQIAPNYTFSTPATFGVTLQATNAAGCTNSQSQNVTITDTPQPDFFIDLPPFSCAGTPTQFNDATPLPNGSNLVSWLWNFGDGATGAQQNPQHIYALPGNYSVTLEAETNFGCKGTTQIEVTIAATPTADFTIGATCLNQGTPFESLSMTGVNAWQWSIGNSVYAIPNPIHTFTQSGTYQATLIVVGQNNCESMVSKAVTIKPVPLLDFSNSIACSGQTTTFTDQSSGTDLPRSWTWSLDGTAGSGSPVSHTFATAGAKPVTMQVITEAGCHYALNKNVIVAPSPTAAFTASPNVGPPPLAVQFTNTSQNATSYAWHFGLSNATSALANPSFTYANVGDYLVELTATNNIGCSDVQSQIISVLIPTYDLTLTSLDILQQTGSSGKSVMITVRNNSNIQINSANTLITGSSGLRVKSNLIVNLAAQTSADFLLPIEVFSNEEYLCVDLDLETDINPADNQRCEALLSGPAVAAPYPNPAQDQIFFDVVMKQGGSGQLRVTDIHGQTVFNEFFQSLSEGLNRKEIDLTAQAPGLYIAIWELSGQVFRLPFLIR